MLASLDQSGQQKKAVNQSDLRLLQGKLKAQKSQSYSLDGFAGKCFAHKLIALAS